MAVYKLEVTTGDMKHAGTMDNIYITLFGTEGQSDRTNLDNLGIDFKSGKVRYIQSNNVYKIGVGGGACSFFQRQSPAMFWVTIRD